MGVVHSNIAESAGAARILCRERIEVLRGRVELLSGRDKVLMVMYLENGNSFRQMARLAGVNEGTISRKINKISHRLIDGEYITCLRNRERFTKMELGVARDHYLLGLSIKRIAAKRGCTYYRIRQILKRIDGILVSSMKDRHSFRKGGNK